MVKRKKKVQNRTTTRPKKTARRRAATKQDHLEQKFRQLGELRRQCPDVTRNVPHTPENVHHKQAFDKIREEIVEAIGKNEYERRFEPYLLHELVRDAIKIIEDHDPHCDWLKEAKETLDDHRAAGS